MQRTGTIMVEVQKSGRIKVAHGVFVEAAAGDVIPMDARTSARYSRQVIRVVRTVLTPEDREAIKASKEGRVVQERRVVSTEAMIRERKEPTPPNPDFDQNAPPRFDALTGEPLDPDSVTDPAATVDEGAAGTSETTSEEGVETSGQVAELDPNVESTPTLTGAEAIAKAVADAEASNPEHAQPAEGEATEDQAQNAEPAQPEAGDAETDQPAVDEEATTDSDNAEAGTEGSDAEAPPE